MGHLRFRLFASSALAVLGTIAAQWTAAAATSFNISNSGMSAYVIDGVNNPNLTLIRGQTYTFTVNTVGHPFWITTARGAGDSEANAFSQGVTGNGASPGTVTFVVPASAPATLFYQCSFHDPMGGILAVVAPAGVPSLGAAAFSALSGLLLLVAVATLRKRQNAMAAMRSHDQ